MNNFPKKGQRGFRKTGVTKPSIPTPAGNISINTVTSSDTKSVPNLEDNSEEYSSIFEQYKLARRARKVKYNDTGPDGVIGSLT